MGKPILCMDFDGARYTSGWKGADQIPDPPVPGAIAFLSKAKDAFDVQIFSSRSNQLGGIDAMRRYMRDAICHHLLRLCARQPPRFRRCERAYRGAVLSDREAERDGFDR
jgi:hypothetical protein